MSAVRKVAAITGGSAGIGLSICEHFLARDYDVISIARRSCELKNRRLHSVEVDLTDRAATTAVARELAAKFEAYRNDKAAAKDRRDQSRARLDEAGRLGRALRLPLLANAAGPILREADRRRLLGSHFIVVGTNAMVAYAIEAGGFMREAPDETDDFDIAWTATEAERGDRVVWDMLKAVDATFTVNLERTFQARNAKAYEVEILVAPSRAATMGRTDQPRPVPMPEQEWLLLGQKVDHVVICRDGSPARIVAPDPRWYALQKLWLGRQAKRHPLKRPKDLKQGAALLNAVRHVMPQYPLDAAFERSLPQDLVEPYREWKGR